jgi:hypothetical protein
MIICETEFSITIMTEIINDNLVRAITYYDLSHPECPIFIEEGVLSIKESNVHE